MLSSDKQPQPQSINVEQTRLKFRMFQTIFVSFLEEGKIEAEALIQRAVERLSAIELVYILTTIDVSKVSQQGADFELLKPVSTVKVPSPGSALQVRAPDANFKTLSPASAIKLLEKLIERLKSAVPSAEYEQWFQNTALCAVDSAAFEGHGFLDAHPVAENYNQPEQVARLCIQSLTDPKIMVELLTGFLLRASGSKRVSSVVAELVENKMVPLVVTNGDRDIAAVYCQALQPLMWVIYQTPSWAQSSDAHLTSYLKTLGVLFSTLNDCFLGGPEIARETFDFFVLLHWLAHDILKKHPDKIRDDIAGDFLQFDSREQRKSCNLQKMENLLWECRQYSVPMGYISYLGYLNTVYQDQISRYAGLQLPERETLIALAAALLSVVPNGRARPEIQFVGELRDKIKNDPAIFSALLDRLTRPEFQCPGVDTKFVGERLASFAPLDILKLAPVCLMVCAHNEEVGKALGQVFATQLQRRLSKEAVIRYVDSASPANEEEVTAVVQWLEFVKHPLYDALKEYYSKNANPVAPGQQKAITMELKNVMDYCLTAPEARQILSLIECWRAEIRNQQNSRKKALPAITEGEKAYPIVPFNCQHLKQWQSQLGRFYKLCGSTPLSSRASQQPVMHYASEGVVYPMVPFVASKPPQVTVIEFKNFFDCMPSNPKPSAVLLPPQQSGSESVPPVRFVLPPSQPSQPQGLAGFDGLLRQAYQGAGRGGALDRLRSGQPGHQGGMMTQFSNSGPTPSLGMLGNNLRNPNPSSSSSSSTSSSSSASAKNSSSSSNPFNKN